MANFDTLLLLDGVTGDCGDETYGEAMGIDHISWGLSTSRGDGPSAGRVRVDDLVVRKDVDYASAQLMSCVSTRAILPTGTLIFRKAGTDRLEYLKIILKDVFVASVSLEGPGEGALLSERVVLNFSEIEFQYNSQSQLGSSGISSDFSYQMPQQ